MPTVARSPAPSLIPWLAGAIVTVLCIVGTVLLSIQQAASAQEVEKARFAQAANSLADALARRIEAFTEIAFGLRGLFIVDPALGRRAFVEAVEALDVGSRHPEIRNIAFTRYVTAAEKQAFEARVRSDTSVEPLGYPEFAIRPPGDRVEYFVAHYLWPMQGNAGVHGLDISAQPTNLASMRHSMRSGQPVASAPFDLVQVATQRAGFVILGAGIPGPGRVSVDQPAASRFLGSVAVTLRLADLMAQLGREGRLQGLYVAMSDMGSSLPDQPGGKAVPLASTMPAGATVPTAYTRDLAVYSRMWRIEFRPASPFLSESEARVPLLIGASGGVIALLLGALVMMLVRARQSALARADASGAALKDSEGRWKFAIEGSGDALWDRDLVTGTVFFSPRWKDMLGFSGEELGNQPDEWTRRVHPDDLPQVLAALQAHLAGTTASYASEHRVACKDGSWKWVLHRGQVVQRDAAGAPLRMIGTLSDITQRKQTAQVLQASLHDKDALLKEVHHRVKNNLQVITSLLRLESRRAAEPGTHATLSELQGRIGSMAMLHESLYRSGTFASVDLADYLAQVAGGAFRSQVTRSTAVRLRTSLAPVQVSMDQALPCGLLVNELVSNCLKHAFPDGRAGDVLVDLQPAQEIGVWTLRVSDTGAGLPAGFDIANQSSMGLQLAGQLCRQLAAALEVQSSPGEGASFTVRFSVDTPAALVMPP